MWLDADWLYTGMEGNCDDSKIGDPSFFAALPYFSISFSFVTLIFSPNKTRTNYRDIGLLLRFSFLFIIIWAWINMIFVIFRDNRSTLVSFNRLVQFDFSLTLIGSWSDRSFNQMVEQYSRRKKQEEIFRIDKEVTLKKSGSHPNNGHHQKRNHPWKWSLTLGWARLFSLSFFLQSALRSQRILTTLHQVQCIALCIYVVLLLLWICCSFHIHLFIWSMPRDR